MMKVARLLIMCAMAFGVVFASHARNYGPELIQACSINSLKSCKFSKSTLKKDQLAQYEKALNCVKYGSTSGDSFDLGLPLPDIGELGVSGASAATYSTEICKDEVKKLNSVNFLKEFTTTFDPECGKFTAGQYQQCLAAAEKLSGQANIQSLTCSGSQSSDQIVVNTKYVPGAQDGPKQYAIASITGVKGLKCDKDRTAGINQYSSFSCALPPGYVDSKLVIKLKNSVSCAISVTGKPRAELNLARQSSCASLLLKNIAELPQIIKVAMLGQCELCVAKNLATSNDDQRILATRIKSCAVWSARSLAEAGASVCIVVPSKETSLMAYDPTNLFAPAIAAPIVTPTAPKTERAGFAFVSLDADTTLAQRWAETLCNGRNAGQILQLNGKSWEEPPLDYLNSASMNDPLTKKILESIENP